VQVEVQIRRAIEHIESLVVSAKVNALNEARAEDGMVEQAVSLTLERNSQLCLTIKHKIY
jgi:hypothetical protein